jgi:hypothetical protein
MVINVIAQACAGDGEIQNVLRKVYKSRLASHAQAKRKGTFSPRALIIASERETVAHVAALLLRDTQVVLKSCHARRKGHWLVSSQRSNMHTSQQCHL